MTPDGRYVAFYAEATNLGYRTSGENEEIYRAELPIPNISKVIKAVESDSPTPGGELMYTITITNSGGDTAVGLSLTDDIPAGTSVRPGSVKCSDGGATVVSEDPINVTNISVEAEKTATVTFKVTIDPDIQTGTIIANQAFVKFGREQIASSPPSSPGSGNPTDITVGGGEARAWIVAEGSTAGGFDSFVLIQNPNDVQRRQRWHSQPETESMKQRTWRYRPTAGPPSV